MCENNLLMVRQRAENCVPGYLQRFSIPSSRTPWKLHSPIVSKTGIKVLGVQRPDLLQGGEPLLLSRTWLRFVTSLCV